MQLACWVPGQTHREQAGTGQSLASCRVVCPVCWLPAVLPQALGLPQGPFQGKVLWEACWLKSQAQGAPREESLGVRLPLAATLPSFPFPSLNASHLQMEML